jgi:uncharacterized membrane protein
MIISIQYLYWLAGVTLAITAFMTATDRTNPKRWSTGLFWGLFAIAFLVGEKLPPVWVGVGVIVMAVIAGFGGVGFGQHENLNDRARRESAGRLKNKLFIPALAIPLVTVIGAVLLKNIKVGDVFLLDPANSTFVSLGIGSLVALALACWLTRDTPVQAMRESRRLTEALGWALCCRRCWRCSAWCSTTLASARPWRIWQRLTSTWIFASSRSWCMCSAWRCSPSSWATVSRRFR